MKGLGNIRVVIVPDEKFYFAQGLEIDYAAQGTTIAEVKKNFELGFQATLDLHLKVHGNVKGFLQPAPPPVWQEFLPDAAAMKSGIFSVSEHAIEHSGLPYDGIQYLVATPEKGP